MNIFRVVADLMHLASFIILLLKITSTDSVSGISLKSQILYFIVFTTRYLDLFWHYVSFYNTVMKIFFIFASGYVVFLMYYKFKKTYSVNDDLFRAEYLVLVSALLSLIFHEKFTLWNVVYTFSIYLEAVAILPQLFMLTRKGEADSITFHYLFALGTYRGLYIFNWIYRYYDNSYFHPYVILAGIVQTALFGDFFYIYVNKDKYLAAAIRLADDPNEGHRLDAMESGIPIDIPVSSEGGEESPKSAAEDEGLLSNPDQVNTEELVYILDNDSLISDMSVEEANPKLDPYVPESIERAQDPAETTRNLGNTSYGTVDDNQISTSEQTDPSPPVCEDISHSHEWNDFKSCLNDPEPTSLNYQDSEKHAGNPEETASDE